MYFSSWALECNSRKSRDNWSNRQVWPWSIEWSREKANRVLPKEHTGHSKHPLPMTQNTTLHMDITSLSIPKSDYVLCSQRWRSSIQSAKTRLGADCGSDHELLIATVRMKLQRRQWHPTPVFLPGESQGQGSLVGCCLWGCTESDTTEAT